MTGMDLILLDIYCDPVKGTNLHCLDYILEHAQSRKFRRAVEKRIKQIKKEDQKLQRKVEKIIRKHS